MVINLLCLQGVWKDHLASIYSTLQPLHTECRSPEGHQKHQLLTETHPARAWYCRRYPVPYHSLTWGGFTWVSRGWLKEHDRLVGWSGYKLLETCEIAWKRWFQAKWNSDLDVSIMIKTRRRLWVWLRAGQDWN